MKHISSKRAKALSIPVIVKNAVWQRDRGRCVYCGSSNASPNAHFISRSKGGLGVPENILTLCLSCHDRFDNGGRYEREGMREYFAEYLQSKYPEWNEDNLTYRKENT